MVMKAKMKVDQKVMVIIIRYHKTHQVKPIDPENPGTVMDMGDSKDLWDQGFSFHECTC